MKRRSFLKFLSILPLIPILGLGKNENVIVDKSYIGITGHPFSPPDFFVDYENGNDNYPGTADKPFRTLQKAIHKANRGDVIFLQPVNYADLII